MSCVVKGCNDNVATKNLMCAKHWYSLPQMLRDDVRKGTEAGQNSLRAHPTREWLGVASRHVGEIKNLSIYVENDKVKRKFNRTSTPEKAAA